MNHVYYGFGKGKSTSAFGLAMRMAGHKQLVLFCQFLKDGSSGEILSGRQIPHIHFRHPKPYLNEESNHALLEVVRMILAASHSYRLIVLDEVLDAMVGHAVTLEEILEIMKACHENEIELVVTGHKPPPDEVLELADYVTFFDKRKHPFDQGSEARIGVEY